MEELGAVRLGHGVRAAEDAALLALLAERQVVCEVCPASNVALGVLPDLAAVPVRQLRAAGVPVALSADDPLLFRSGLVEQYEAARRALGLDDAALADLAACSVRGSTAPADVQQRLLDGIAGWLAGEPPAIGPGAGAERQGRAGHDVAHGTSGTYEAAGEGAPRPPGGPVSATRGVLYVHSCPPALVPHVEWAVAAELGVRVSLPWTDQPAAPGTLRSESGWQGRAETAGRLAAALRGWQVLRYEVTEQASPGCDGERWSVTPSLGVFRSATSANGDLLVGEDRLRALLASATGPQLAHGIDRLLGGAWDDELESFRRAGEGAAVHWLHQVV